MLNTPQHSQLLERIVLKTRELGFDYVGMIPVSASETIAVYTRWLEQGYAGNMEYLHRHQEKKHDPREVLPETQSLIILGMNYHTVDPSKQELSDPSLGVISRYAWGNDYHDVIFEKMRMLREFVEQLTATEFRHKAFVDTGPVLEREYAWKAGLGWFGKHSNLISGKQGSWIFLAEMLLNLQLCQPLPMPKGGCGTCTRCIDACPTRAIVADRVVDARHCISYLTIELREAIPRELRPLIGNRIFGCDICQEVCPWNKSAEITTIPDFFPRPENYLPSLISLMGLSQEDFSHTFRKSPIKRTKRRGLLRNVAVALGNWKNPVAIPVLKQALYDEEPLIREHAAWALGEIQHSDVETILKLAIQCEEVSTVRHEIHLALEKYSSGFTL
ncbi:MAG: tRNA epoxyqueuosine(34) reductase QueG [SAR324 cluster bacterium]|nr:tRNA epoxyqueuosine(34) reductase QueG [SAR324 cluster bacterium]